MNAYKSLSSWLSQQLKQFNQDYIRLIEVDNIRKSRVVCCCLIFFHAFFYLSIFANQTFELFDTANIPRILLCFAIFILFALLLFLMSYVIQATPKSEFYFPIICVGFYSGSLMMIGYIAGMMTILTGTFTMGSILSGLLLFERRIIFYACWPCILVFYISSFLNVFDILPYAPLYKPYTMLPAGTQNYVILVNLFSSTFIAIVLARLFNSFLERWKDRERKQRILMNLDPLTQILNRRGITEHFTQIQNDDRRKSKNVCVALIDIDHFKSINDRYGHDCGDQVIITISQTLALNTRQKDHLGRFGGEEFIIVFEDTSLEIAHQIVERCRLAIEAHRLDYQGEIIQFTASFGLAASTLELDDQQSFILKADQALYQAKNSGRNRICTS